MPLTIFIPLLAEMGIIWLIVTVYDHLEAFELASVLAFSDFVSRKIEKISLWSDVDVHIVRN